MNFKPGTKYLITMGDWFITPTGTSVKSVYGTIKDVIHDSEGFLVSITIGCMQLYSCQIVSAIEAPKVELGLAKGWVFAGTPEATEYSHPSSIFNADPIEAPAKLHVIKQ